ncbi:MULTISPECIES: cell wall metabolism sensor histidine kinase WalK [unclassified Streptomyces]|uniref:sensor histidine kinase n=1 Tax=unclassified Streptomyces TaxID=2593676 RepID=UPI001EF2EC7E|nr:MULTISPECIES: ATP-binding protein [unclassified Streptomyces]
MSRFRLRLWRLSSERARLTSLYGGLLVLAGGVLIALVYSLVRSGLYSTISLAVTTAVPIGGGPRSPYALPTRQFAEAQPALPLQGQTFDAAKAHAATKMITTAAESAALSKLLTVSLISLAVFAVLSVALAWWMAGRVLRPVGVITSTARRLSGENLHERIKLKAPPGELKQLADTFDTMLDRIEQLVSAQQRFVANAAHELRTPLAVQRAAAEIGLADPDLDPERLARLRGKLIDVADDSEKLIDGLLLLSASDQGLERVGPIALDATAASVATALADQAGEHGVTVGTELRPLTVQGEAVLLGHLVHNLVSNAIRYNHPGGQVWVRVGADGLEVVNTGPEVPVAEVPELFEPFRRMQARRHGPGEGAGLGLSIVASIARAHGAVATAAANPGGGLTVRVAGFQPAGSRKPVSQRS